MERKRCFISLRLPREAINYIKGVQDLIGKQNLFTGKFTEPENLHLTLKFLGEVDGDKIEEVKERLKKIKFNSFDVKLGDVGVFSRSIVRIIWIKLNGCSELQKKVDDCLEGLFDKEERFMSHITIARVKWVGGNKKALLDYINRMKIKKIRFKVDRFYLEKSELFSSGPVYEGIGEFGLSPEKHSP